MTYTQNLVFQNIEVIAYFKELGIKIIKFRWNNTVYKVTKIPNQWKIKDGEDFKTHFQSSVKTTVLSLSFVIITKILNGN